MATDILAEDTLTVPPHPASEDSPPTPQTTGGQALERPLPSDTTLAFETRSTVDEGQGSSDVQPYKPDIQDFTWMDRVLEEANKYSDPKEREYFIQKTARTVRNNIAMQAAAVRQQQQTNRTQIDQVLIPPIQATGTGPRSIDEALKVDPDFNNRLDLARKYDPKIDQYVQSVFKKNIANDNMDTPERRQNYETLKGLSISNPDEFINKSVADFNLTARHSTELTLRQATLRTKQEDTTKLKAAMDTLSPLLNPIGAYQSHTNKSAQAKYDLVLGQLIGAFDDLKADGKPIPRDFRGLQAVAAPVIQKIPGSWFPTGPGEQFSDRYAFQPPDDVRKLLVDRARADLKREPTEAEIGWGYHKYLRGQQGAR